MKKQILSYCKETEQLLQNIIERQKRLNELSLDMQENNSNNNKKEINVNFDWLSKIEQKLECPKLSKAV